MVTLTRRAVLVGAAAAGTLTAGITPRRTLGLSGRSLILTARPDPVTIDTARTAVLVVDMQNDFGAPGGMLDRAGVDISAIRRSIAPIANSLDVARSHGIPVVYLKMGFKPDLSDLGSADSTNRIRHLRFGVGENVSAPDGKDSRMLIRDTWNTDILPELEPHEGDIVMYKTRFSGFYQTDLHEELTSLGIRDLIVTGCTTSVCVESTIRDAMFRDYRCVLLEDCTSEPIGSDFARSNHAASLLTIEMLLGWVSESAHFVEALEA